ncbi:hypothetical protein OCU04_001356 [Sclerotinia nivalis]|uniref:Uncharacterized protein n=1 Tax=Sclerotinia nivalis TaxID=352851 RepID=A0A9X0AXZ8_9HELO|nr:hypothetical protein OCU04_001356 [Sclerotinia nivalis]
MRVGNFEEELMSNDNTETTDLYLIHPLHNLKTSRIRTFSPNSYLTILTCNEVHIITARKGIIYQSNIHKPYCKYTIRKPTQVRITVLFHLTTLNNKTMSPHPSKASDMKIKRANK